ncbi:MAG TPA: hypothetical protein PLU13_01725 [Thermomonas sp.]|nr:hypothetical protein [Xanthomonadales bacterium]MBP7418657.1 hypothetical protein [Xanthomonadales bacterium]HQW58897.1 hypothetical protein [Thermomonas sp.]HQX94051.1 hypothetical protein [Thermomonas sp.]
MKRIGIWTGQFLLYAAFAAAIALFSRWPAYQHLAPDQALVKLSFVHHGERLGECQEQTLEELAKLPPNMRAPTRCPRERSPVTVELDIDGVPAYRHVAQPSGLSRDGASAVYHRQEVAAGPHRIAVRLKDDPRSPGFDYVLEEDVELAAAQILVIDFDSADHRITLR